MPLDAHDEVVVTALQGFDHPIFGPARNSQSFADVSHRLMVVTVPDNSLPEQVPQLARWVDRHGLSGELSRRDEVAVITDDIGQMLMQGPASADIQYLHAATDCENRHPAPIGFVEKAQFPVVPPRVSLVVVWARLLAVQP